jgi:hypothetical protein
MPTYVLQYKSQKAEFFKAVWNLWTWDDISPRLSAARGLEMTVAGRPMGMGKAR